MSRSLLKLLSIELVMPSNHLTLCHPLFLQPSIFPTIRVFSNESVLRIRWPKYWSFSFSISPSNEYSGLMSLRMDWLDLLEVQGTLKTLLQHHNSKASVFWCSAFFIVQLSHSNMTTGKTIALTRWTFVGQVISMLFIIKRLIFFLMESVNHCIFFCGYVIWGKISSVQSLSHVQLFATPWTAACQVSLSFTISWSLLKLMSIELVMPSNHLILSSPSPPAFSLF